jgi:hypothetical protein
MHEIGEAEAREDPAERPFEVVPAGVVEVVLQVRISLERFLVRVAEPVLELAQLGLALVEVRGRAAGVLLDGAGRVLEQLLAQEADAHAARVRDEAGVRLVEASAHPEERRLPGPVRTDETDAVPFAEAERDVVEQLAVAEPAPDGLDRQEAHVGFLISPS